MVLYSNIEESDPQMLHTYVDPLLYFILHTNNTQEPENLRALLQYITSFVYEYEYLYIVPPTKSSAKREGDRL